MKAFHPYLSFGRYGCEVKKDVDVNHEKYKNSFFLISTLNVFALQSTRILFYAILAILEH